MSIPAIETRYKGHRFRSRLEARWAVFFDALGLIWEYEKEGFEIKIDGKTERYLPDFWLPEVGIFVEIKGELSSFSEVRRCQAIRDQIDKGCAIFGGPPREKHECPNGTVFTWDATDSSGGSSRFHCRWGWSHKGDCAFLVVNDDRSCRDFYLQNAMRDPAERIVNECHARDVLTIDEFSLSMKYAVDAARSVRFEKYDATIGCPGYCLCKICKPTATANNT